MSKTNRPFILITLGVFIILFFSKVFQHGLFFDGLIYAAVAQNLSLGNGTFWVPQFSQTIFPEFFEHPPLVFGIEGSMMRLFQEAFFTEKLFSFLMAASTVVFVGLIWKKIMPEKKLQQLYWLPILFWVITPKNSWSFTNNLLENAVCMFSIASVYCVLVALQKTGVKRTLFILIASGLVSAGFLSKGFPALFPLGFFFVYWLFFRKTYTLQLFLKDTVLLFLGIGVILGGIYYFSSAAQHNFLTYLDQQVLGSITGKNRVGSRIVLMKNLFNELIPILILVSIVFLIFRRRLGELFKQQAVQNKWALFFVCIGLSASVPLMVSLKISSFYLIPTLPYFDLALALLISSFVAIVVERNSAAKSARLSTLILGVLTVLVGVGLTVKNVNTVGRNSDILHDMAQIKPFVGEEAIFSIHSSYKADWTTIAYFQRYLRVSFDRSDELQEFHLIPKGEQVPENYERIPLDTEKYSLVKRM
jgi:hypothetical protein